MPLTRLLTCCFVAGFCAQAALIAGERVVLKNGFTLEADSHSSQGSIVQFRVGAGTMEFQTSEIETISCVATPVDVAATVQSANGLARDVSPELLLAKTAVAQGMDEAFVRSVAKVESGLHQQALSVKGAVGLMQLMPATAKELGVDPTKLQENILGGVQYLRTLLLRYGGDSALALAAYNAGPGAVQHYKGVPPYRQTRQYVLSVLREYKHQVESAKKPASKPNATD